MRRAAPFLTIFVIQAVCAVFFVSDILASVLGVETTPISWEMRELMEIGASVGLVLGVVVGGLMLHRALRDRTHALRDRNEAEERLRRASGAFMDLLEERFEEWGLTAAERDVALFAIKGCSVAEIAGMRGTSEGTVKAQTAAVYRKAGVANRHQLLSLFIEDLFDPDLAARPDAAPAIDQAAPSPAPVSASASAVASPAQQ